LLKELLVVDGLNQVCVTHKISGLLSLSKQSKSLSLLLRLRALISITLENNKSLLGERCDGESLANTTDTYSGALMVVAVDNELLIQAEWLLYTAEASEEPPIKTESLLLGCCQIVVEKPL
jgi:hypothetical protein